VRRTYSIFDSIPDNQAEYYDGDSVRMAETEKQMLTHHHVNEDKTGLKDVRPP
jgi:hypothetical protein